MRPSNRRCRNFRTNFKNMELFKGMHPYAMCCRIPCRNHLWWLTWKIWSMWMAFQGALRDMEASKPGPVATLQMMTGNLRFRCSQKILWVIVGGVERKGIAKDSIFILNAIFILGATFFVACKVASILYKWKCEKSTPKLGLLQIKGLLDIC